MNCIKCYKEIPDDAKFCPHCGAPQPEAGPVHAEAGAAAESVTTAEDAAQQTENTAQQTENTAQQTESAAQQTRDPGYQYQQSGPVYQSEPTPIYQQPVNGTPLPGTVDRARCSERAVLLQYIKPCIQHCRDRLFGKDRQMRK